MMAPEEFYIGYQRDAPKGLARLMRNIALSVWFGIIGVGLIVALLQQPFDEGTFEFGVVKEFEGVLLDTPLPHLRLTRAQGEYDAGTLLLLVSQGKHGFPAYAREGFGKIVQCSGSLIRQGSMVMLEMAGSETFRVMGEADDLPADRIRLGEMTLVGELVDSKCYLGVMRPAAGKVHRACASNCLRGGIPPALLVRTTDDVDVAILLASGESGEWNVDYQWAGRIIRVHGELSQHSGVPVLTATKVELLR